MNADERRLSKHGPHADEAAEKVFSQGMALRPRGIQVVGLPLWGGAMRCQENSSSNFFRSRGIPYRILRMAAQ